MARLHVAFLVLPGAQLLDFIGPFEVFHAATQVLARRDETRRGYRLTLAGPASRVVASGGVTFDTVPLERLAGRIDTLVIPGGIDYAERAFDRGVTTWIGRRAPRIRRVASICSGAFLLAELGLLDGRRATTHWLAVEALRRRVPSADVEADALYVKDGPIYTSAGVTAGMDLALALVEDDFGPKIALTVARVLVMFLHRPGGQSQFSAALGDTVPQHAGIRAVRAHVIEHPRADHRVPALARRAGMSQRNFVRVFTAQTGETPARFVLRVRLERARQLLERTASSIEEVADRCGFGSAETMRRRFQRDLGITPSAYRRRFQTRAG